PSGSVRMRLPVILKAAWAMADAVCGIACSPTPEIHLLLGPRLGRAIEGLRGVAAGPPGRTRCPRSAAIFASGAPTATTCSWRRARRSTRSMSPRRERWYQSLELVSAAMYVADDIEGTMVIALICPEGLTRDRSGFDAFDAAKFPDLTETLALKA